MKVADTMAFPRCAERPKIRTHNGLPSCGGATINETTTPTTLRVMTQVHYVCMTRVLLDCKRGMGYAFAFLAATILYRVLSLPQRYPYSLHNDCVFNYSTYLPTPPTPTYLLPAPE
jgi:hypothetical protein